MKNYSHTKLAAPSLHNSLFFLMGTVHRKFKNEGLSQLHESLDVTTEMLKAMEVLSYHELLSQKQLSDSLMLEKSSTKRLVDNLLKRELVNTVPHAENQRLKLLQLTPLGEEVRHQGSEIMRTLEKKWLSNLEENDANNIKQALTKLLEGH